MGVVANKDVPSRRRRELVSSRSSKIRKAKTIKVPKNSVVECTLKQPFICQLIVKIGGDHTIDEGCSGGDFIPVLLR